MGLTREQWHVKRLAELEDYVRKHGRKVKDVIYWDTYPICVKDICVLGVAIINGELVFTDYDSKEAKFRIRREAVKEERKWLEDALEQMKNHDKFYKSKK